MCRDLSLRLRCLMKQATLAVTHRRMSRCERDPPATEAVKNLLDQNITQVTEIRRLGRGQSIGSRCDKFNATPPQVSEASSSNQPFNELTAEARVAPIGTGI